MRSIGTDAGARQVKAPPRARARDQLADLGDLAARDGDVGLPGPLVKALPDLLQEAGVGLLDGDVVEHAQRLGPHAQDVVDVHGHAIDADGVVLVQHLGDEQLGSDAVGGKGQAEAVPEVQHAGKVAEVQGGSAGTELQRPPHPLEQSGQRRFFLDGVDARLRVARLSHDHDAPFLENRQPHL